GSLRTPERPPLGADPPLQQRTAERAPAAGTRATRHRSAAGSGLRRRMRRWLLTLLLLAPGPEIVFYRCTDASGALTVQNLPCPKGTQQTRKVMQAPATPPPPPTAPPAALPHLLPAPMP